MCPSGATNKIGSVRNMNQIVKVLICVMMLTTIFVATASASVGSEQAKYANADEKEFAQMEKSFQCQYSQFAGKTNVIVISNSANFENSNSVRSYEVLEDAKLRLTDYQGRTETVSVTDLQNKYECCVMAQAPQTFDTSGNMTANLYEMRDEA